MIKYKSVMRPTAIGLCIANLLTYIPFHIYYALMLDDAGVTAEYAYRYLSLIYGIAAPVAVSAVALKILRKVGAREMLISLIEPSLARIVFCLPYYYIYYVSLGYDSVESLCMTLPTTLLAVAVGYIASLCLTALAHKGSRAAEALKEDSGLFKAAVIASAISTSVTLIPEIIHTVSFFIEYWDSFSSLELTYTASRYLVILVVAVAVIPGFIYLYRRAEDRLISCTIEIIEEDK